MKHRSMEMKITVLFIVIVSSLIFLFRPLVAKAYSSNLTHDSSYVAGAADICKTITNNGTEITEGTRDTSDFIFIPYSELPGVDYECPLDDDLQEYIYSVCQDYAISYSFVMSIIWHESEFDPSAHNGNCKGLMQINESTHKDRMQKLGVTDLYDPYQNILVGIDYLTELFEKYEDCYTVLISYNGGESYMNRLADKGIYSSRYSRWIVDKAMELTDLYGY